MLKAALVVALVCASYGYNVRRGTCTYKGNEYSEGEWYDGETRCFCRYGKAGCVGKRELDDTTCTYKGKTHPVGQFYDGCNRCECRDDGSFGCVGCPVKPDTTCKLNGQTYPVGKFMDGCNSCECHSDGSMSCVGCPIALKPTCTLEGKNYAVGKFMDGCNSCECHEDGSVGCVGCPLSPPSRSVRVVCHHHGKYQDVGKFNDGVCEKCECKEDARVTCTGCPAAENNKDYPDEDLKPKAVCLHKGKFHGEGKFKDGCNQCDCHGDASVTCVGCPLSQGDERLDRLFQALKKRLFAL